MKILIQRNIRILGEFREIPKQGNKQIQGDSDTEKYTDTWRFQEDFDTEKYTDTWRIQGDSDTGK